MSALETVVRKLSVPFFRPSISTAEIEEVSDTLRNGWLTTGPKVKRFENSFKAYVGAKHAVGVNSCTAALHLALEALSLRPGQGVLLPTMTFAATAEVVRYQGAVPILVDCDPVTLNLDLADVRARLEQVRAGNYLPRIDPDLPVVGIIPVHVGGMMMDMAALRMLADDLQLWVVEDAAHAFPAAWRANDQDSWQQCGEGTSTVACFSFYANKTITTGEGGMAVTNDSEIAERMRMMSLHGLSHDAWGRYTGGGAWDYKIMAPGFKYNLTDIAGALGIHQLARAEEMRLEREAIAQNYLERLRTLDEIELPAECPNRIHAWHLFPIRLRLEKLSIDRNQFVDDLKKAGVGCSVHWRPLHLHPYYEQLFGWKPEDFPVATAVWKQLISLPLFPGMRVYELEHVVSTIEDLCVEYGRRAAGAATK